MKKGVEWRSREERREEGTVGMWREERKAEMKIKENKTLQYY